MTAQPTSSPPVSPDASKEEDFASGVGRRRRRQASPSWRCRCQVGYPPLSLGAGDRKWPGCADARDVVAFSGRPARTLSLSRHARCRRRGPANVQENACAPEPWSELPHLRGSDLSSVICSLHRLLDTLS
jgi:hypothetical protein